VFGYVTVGSERQYRAYDTHSEKIVAAYPVSAKPVQVPDGEGPEPAARPLNPAGRSRTADPGQVYCFRRFRIHRYISLTWFLDSLEHADSRK